AGAFFGSLFMATSTSQALRLLASGRRRGRPVLDTSVPGTAQPPLCPVDIGWVALALLPAAAAPARSEPEATHAGPGDEDKGHRLARRLGLSPVVLGWVRGAWPNGLTVTKDRARKKIIRARAAATGEPYSVAARNLGADAHAHAASEVVACARAT